MSSASPFEAPVAGLPDLGAAVAARVPSVEFFFLFVEGAAVVPLFGISALRVIFQSSETHAFVITNTPMTDSKRTRIRVADADALLAMTPMPSRASFFRKLLRSITIASLAIGGSLFIG